MKNIKLSVKLIAALVLIAFVVGLSIRLITQYYAEKSLIENTNMQLVSTQKIKSSEIEQYFNAVFADIQSLAEAKDATIIFDALHNYYNTLENTAETDDFPVNTNQYTDLHKKYGKFYTNHKERFNYSDILLICKKHGHVMFSAKKAEDLGANLIHGKLKNTHLAKVWEKVIETGKVQLVDIQAYEPDNNKPSLFVAAPVYKEKELFGVIAIQINENQTNKLVNTNSFIGKTGKINIIGKSESGAISLRNDIKGLKKIGDKMSGELISKAFAGESGIGEKKGVDGNIRLAAYSPLKIKGLSWIAIATIDKSEITDKITEMRNATFQLGIPIMILVVIMAFFLAKTITKPILKGVKFAEKVVSGNYNAEIDIHQKDEIGVLADALRNMLKSFKKGVNYAEKIASGDLSSSGKDKNQYSPLEIALSAMKDKLNKVIENISSVTQNISSDSDQLNSIASQIASGSNEQASSTEEVSASMEEMVANINQNTENALITEKISVKSAEGIIEGNESFKVTLDAMREIAKKITIIGDIAEKTDILAINAAIEAARAGEQGKGFAVVATEIRKLAENSQTAAKEINNLVGTSVNIAEKSGKLLSKISPEIQKTSVLVQEIANAGNEQNSGANQINDAIQGLTKVIQENTSAADQMAASSKNMSLQAIQLEEAVAFFKTTGTNVNSENIVTNKIEEKSQNEPLKKQSQNKTQKGGYELKLKESNTNDDEFEKY